MTVVSTPRPVTLSARQLWILNALAGGSTRQAIAAELRVAPSTVTGYLGGIYAALRVGGAPEAMAVAFKLGLLSGSDPLPPRGGPREVLEMVLAKDFDGAYSLAIEVVAGLVAAERRDAAAAGLLVEVGR